MLPLIRVEDTSIACRFVSTDTSGGSDDEMEVLDVSITTSAVMADSWGCVGARGGGAASSGMGTSRIDRGFRDAQQVKEQHSCSQPRAGHASPVRRCEACHTTMHSSANAGNTKLKHVDTLMPGPIIAVRTGMVPLRRVELTLSTCRLVRADIAVGSEPLTEVL